MKNTITLDEPSKTDYQKYLSIFNSKYASKFCFAHSSIIDNVFKQYEKNIIAYNYVKAAIIDYAYSTRVKHMDDLVLNITNIKNFDSLVNKGEPNLINNMKKVALNNDEEINYLSFSSKYCHIYNPKEYPIYDSYVERVLRTYQKQFHFFDESERKITKESLKDYVFYKEVVDAFISKYKSIGIDNYEKFDRYLWTIGKENL